MNLNKYVEKLNKNKLAIFLFHGIIKVNNNKIRNYTNKHITSNFFESLLKKLKKKGNPISLREAISCITKKEKFPEYAFCITFDDGFKNNLKVGAPILRKLKIPATFFVSSDLVTNNSMTWIDSIEYCLEKSNVNNINIPGLPNKINIIKNEEKFKILKYLRKYVKSNADSVNTKKLVNNFFKKSDLKKIKLYGNGCLDKKLNWNDVKKINSEKLFDIGGHSHDHVSFGFLSKKETEFQIKKSIRIIKKHTGILVDLYSYPEGQEIDFDDNTIKILKKNKIICCPTAIKGVNNLHDDLFYLKRIIVE